MENSWSLLGKASFNRSHWEDRPKVIQVEFRDLPQIQWLIIIFPIEGFLGTYPIFRQAHMAEYVHGFNLFD